MQLPYAFPYLEDSIAIKPIDEQPTFDDMTEWIVRDLNSSEFIYTALASVPKVRRHLNCQLKHDNWWNFLLAIIQVALRFGVDIGFKN